MELRRAIPRTHARHPASRSRAVRVEIRYWPCWGPEAWLSTQPGCTPLFGMHPCHQAITVPAGSFGLALTQRRPPDPSSCFLCTKHNSGSTANASDTNRFSPRRLEAVATNPWRRAPAPPLPAQVPWFGSRCKHRREMGAGDKAKHPPLHGQQYRLVLIAITGAGPQGQNSYWLMLCSVPRDPLRHCSPGQLAFGVFSFVH